MRPTNRGPADAAVRGNSRGAGWGCGTCRGCAGAAAWGDSGGAALTGGVAKVRPANAGAAAAAAACCACCGPVAPSKAAAGNFSNNDATKAELSIHMKAAALLCVVDAGK